MGIKLENIFLERMKLFAGLLLSAQIEASHFRGIGYNVIQGDNGNVFVSRTTAWRIGMSSYTGGCTAAHVAAQTPSLVNGMEICDLLSGGACGSLFFQYIVTDIENLLAANDNFCYGYRQDTMVKPTGPYKMTWGNTAWVPFITDAGGVAGSGAYGFTAYIYDVDNNTPQVKLPPIWKILSGCAAQTLDLSPIDLDGDTVICKWATLAEAQGAYRGGDFNSITLDETTCILTYDGTQDVATTGVKPIAVQVMDYDANGVLRSSMPVQFLATVWTPSNTNFASNLRSGAPFVYDPPLFSDIEDDHDDHFDNSPRRTRRATPSYCDAKPVLSEASPAAGSVLDATSGISVTVTAEALPGTFISRFVYNSPIGMSCGAIQNDELVYSADCSWVPDASQMEQVFNFCFLAEDSNGMTSERRCIKLSAGADVPLSTPLEFPCPSSDCWDYDIDTKACSMKGECASLDCDATKFDVAFKSGLFNLEENQLAVKFANGLTAPTWDSTTLQWTTSAALGTSGMKFEIDNVKKEITFSVLFAIVGNDMPQTRTDEIDDFFIKLGSKTVVTTPFGAGVIFQCIYPLTVEISSEDFTVSGASVIDIYSATGSLASGFEMVLNGGADPSFILGSILPIAITWSITSLPALTFYLEQCTVTHGATTIQVVKGGCYAAELDVTHETSLQEFSYKVFKGVGETSTTQTIECTVNICEASTCPVPTISTCPSAGDDSFYGYTI